MDKLSLFQAFDLLSNTTILGAFYGITLTLYCLCVRSLYLQPWEPDKRRQTRFTLAYISLLLFCITAYLASSVRMIQLAYIDHNSFPGGPLEYKESYISTTSSHMLVIGVFNLIVEVLTMAIQIWRLWVIWSVTRYAIAVTILPVLLLLSHVALSIPIGIGVDSLSFNRLGISAHSAFAMGTASFAVLSGLTIVVTGLVVARLLWLRRNHVKIMGTSDTANPYLSIVTMLIESYALESAWSVAAAISVGTNDPSIFLFVTNDATIKVIAYYLVVYRVSVSRGCTTEVEPKLTALQWDRSTRTSTDEMGGVHS